MAMNEHLEIPEIALDAETTTQEHVYARLRHAIMVGAIPPGSSLTMRGLAGAMGLSPTPVREAVRRLSSERAIEIKQNRRMLVPEMTLGRFEELVALRIALEVHAAERALPYVSDIKIQTMVEIDQAMDEAIEANNLDSLTMLNQDFHRTLYTVNPNQVAMPVIESIWLQLGPFQRQVIERLGDYYEVDRHKEIIEALRARDAAALMVASESDIRDGIGRNGRQLLTRNAARSTAA